MRGMTELIREHNAYMRDRPWNPAIRTYHLAQIEFLQHERLVHLIVMLCISFCALVCLALYLYLDLLLLIIAFGLFLILTLFYVFHYYRLENTVIEWYFIYNDHTKKEPGQQGLS